MLILAVDDDPDDLALFTEALRVVDPSAKLITAADGVEALNYLTRNVLVLPDIIFLDINMPRMDGRECLKFIRNEKSLRNVHVIMYSTTVSSADMQLFKRLDVRFITKPSSFEKLVTVQREIVEAFRQSEATPVSLYRHH